jgi:hypothetical protein
MKTILKLGIFILGILVGAQSLAQAPTDFRKKAEQKHGARWTLEDWLAQKERNKMMDLWLAMYAPSPYEFFISAQKAQLDPTPSATNSDSEYLRGRVGAYATVLGLEFDYEKNSDFTDFQGALNLRLAGNAQQGTHLNILGGLRTLENSSQNYELKQSFYGADLNLYLTRYFGLSGRYLKFSPKNVPSLGEVSGDQTEYGIFIDFWSVRVSGELVDRYQLQKLNGVNTEVENKGSKFGITFYF